jgi:hypothetical protein
LGGFSAVPLSAFGSFSGLNLAGFATGSFDAFTGAARGTFGIGGVDLIRAISVSPS